MKRKGNLIHWFRDVFFRLQSSQSCSGSGSAGLPLGRLPNPRRCHRTVSDPESQEHCDPYGAAQMHHFTPPDALSYRSSIAGGELRRQQLGRNRVFGSGCKTRVASESHLHSHFAHGLGLVVLLGSLKRWQEVLQISPVNVRSKKRQPEASEFSGKLTLAIELVIRTACDGPNLHDPTCAGMCLLPSESYRMFQQGFRRSDTTVP